MQNRIRVVNSEAGAALVLALVFIVAVALLLGALVSLAGPNLLYTTQAQNQRTSEYNADAAVDGAIQALRSQAPTPSITNPICPTFPTSGSVNGLVVECSMAIPPNYNGRIVQFEACPAPGGTFTNCQANAILQSEVVYNDGCATLAAGCYGNASVNLTVVNWVVERANS
jgi:type II secretory pathway pseudopilin PulG